MPERGGAVLSFLKINLFNRLIRAPADAGASERARGAERYRRALLSALANLAAKALGFGVFALGIRRASQYLDAESLGLWLAVSGFAGALSFLDLGMANAMTNRVAEANSRKLPAALAQVVSGGIGSLLVLGGLLIVACSLVAQLPGLAAFFHLAGAPAVAALTPTLLVFSSIFGLSLAANAAVRVLVALQDGYQAYLWSAAVNLLAMLCLAGPWLEAPSIPVLLALCYGLPALAGIGLFVPLWRRGLLVCSGLGAQIRAELPALLRPAGIYFLLQLGTVVAAGADGMLISATLGVSGIASFAAAQKLFQLVQVPLGTMNAPLWAAYADAAARGDRAFVRLTLQRSLIITAFLVVASAALILTFGPWAISVWTHGRVLVPGGLLLALATFTLADGLGATFGVFLNGTGILRPQLISLVPMLVLGVGLKVWLLGHHGVEAMLLGYTLLYTCITGLVYGVLNRHLVARQFG